MDRANTLVVRPAGYRVTRKAGGAIRMHGPEGQTYTIDSRGRTCSCPAGVYRGRCKHLDAVRGLMDLLGGIWTQNVPECAPKRENER